MTCLPYQSSSTVNSIHTLVLDQPVGGLDEHFRTFLVDKGHRLRKLSLRVHAASLLDLGCVLTFCQGLRIFQVRSDFLCEHDSRVVRAQCHPNV